MDKSRNRTDLLAAGRKKLLQFRQKKGGRKPGKPGGDSGEVDEEHVSSAPEGDRSGSEQCNGDTAAVNGAEVADQCNGDGSGAGVPVEDVRDEAGGDVAREVAEVSASGIKECREEGEDLAAIPVILENGGGGDVAASLSGTVEGGGDEAAANSSGMVDEGSVLQSVELVSDPMSVGPAEELHREETGSPSSRSGLEVGFQDREHVVSENSDADTICLNEEATTPMILENGGDDEGECIVDSTPSMAIPISATADGEGTETTSSSADMGVEHVVSGSSEVGTSGLHEETIASLTQGNVSSIPVEEFEVDVNDIDERKEEVSHREHLKVPSATQDSVGEYGSHVDDAKEGGGTDGESTEQVSVTGDVVGESKPVGEPVALEEEDSLVPVDSNSDGRLESLRSHLYLTNVEKDFLRLQLAELVVDSSDEVSKLRGLVKEALEIKDAVCEELVRCRSELRAAVIEKEKLENQCSSMKEEIDQSQTVASELQTKLEQSQEEHSRVSAELANCSCSLEVLQRENLELAAKLVSETDARTKLVEENTRLASDLLEQKDKLLIALDKQMQLEGNLRETAVSFEELAMENLYLSSNVVVYESKIKELDDFHIEAREEVPSSNNSRIEGSKTGNAIDDSQIRHEARGIDFAPGTSVDSAALQKDDGIVSGSSDAFGVLKRHLEDALNGVDNLEKSVQDMHFHTVSLSRSAGRAAAPGISKLIQAFESKTHVEDAPEVVPVTEGGWSEDAYISVSREVCSLKDLLKLMELDVGMVQEHTRIPYEQLEMECEAQRQQNNILQIKITNLVEELSKYISRTDNLQNCLNEIQQSANYQSEMFLSQVESLQKEVNDSTSICKQERVFLSGVITEAVEKLNAYTGFLPSEDLDIGSAVLASVDAAMEAIKSLHKELEAAHLNNNTLTASCEELNSLCTDIQGRKDFTVEILNKYYRSLTELVLRAGEAETVVISEEELPDNYEKLVEHLQVLMDERLHLLSTNSKLESELLNGNQVIEELNMRCTTLDNKLEGLCHDNDRLESVLAKNAYDIEEFNRRCLVLMQKLEESDCTEDPETIPRFADNTDNDFYNSALFRLEAFVASHIKKHEGAVEQINSSKNYLRDVFKLSEISAISWSSPLLTFLQREIVPHVNELQEKLQLLNTSNLQLESELYNLREGFGKVDETLKVAQSELHLKASELEQSEQRLASVREKLGMAVAKGKGLIVQRDSLKQSLTEKSSELERCTQELVSKDALLHEVEAKFKACSEVERVEALESELSYIRNSATALRDSFLLKDSVLQRIEEVLEDLDLPEHFHSKDIIEKIELLARLVIDNTSFSMTDWDQKSSAGVSHSDAGFLGTDTWKDELAPSSNPEFDEFKRKHEELQNKLYVLAEHNNALEQLLLEKNNLLQKWEEVLNGIDVPSQLQSLDPEDRIEWSKRAFAEVQQERDSLHLKIENLEVSSDMLIVDLEESHKKISELSAEVVAVKYEKEFFSESLNKLRYEYLGLSEKSVHDEIDNDNLRRELDDLHEKMVKNSESKDHEVDKEMWRLHDLIINCLPDADRFETPSGGSSIECLERLLKNLLDHYSTLQALSMHKDLEEFVPRESSISVDKTESDAVSEVMDQELPGLKLKLDEATRDLVLVTEERNKALEKYHSLMLETETISNQMNMLQEERTKDVEKYQSLELELETVIKQRDALQEQLDQEEQKSVAVDSLLLEIEAIRNQQNLLQEERNSAVEKYQSLVVELETTVKQRDALQEQLDQEEQKSVAVDSLLMEIEAIRNQQNLLQEERTNDIEKYQSLVLELGATVKQRDALQEQLDQDAQKIEAMIKQRDILQERLDQEAQKLVATMKQNDALQEQVAQEAQKSASAREKLNVAVRKGKTLVQQRDSLKQTIEEMNTALEHLKIEQSQRVESLESDISLLTNRLAETEHSFHDNNQYLSRILTALEHIDVGSEVGIFDPVQKIEANERLCHELRSAAISSEHEATKSRHAAELLHAELTEVQERSDALQEELTEAIAAKSNAFSRLEQFMLIHSEERKKQIDTLARLESGIYELKKGCFEFSNLLSNVFTKDMDLFRYLEAFIESLLKQMNGENDAEVPVLASSTLLFNHTVKEGRFLNVENDLVANINEPCDESSIAEHLALAASNLHDCIREYDDAKENIHGHSFTIDQQATNLLNTMQTVQRNLASHKKYSESLKRDMTDLESMIKEKETEVRTLQKNVCLLYDACSSSIMELGNRKALVDGNILPPENHVYRKSGVALELPSYSDAQYTIDGQKFPLDDDSVRMVAETLLSTLKGSSNISEKAEANQKELKSTIADLQRELQEKDIQMNSISADLVSQIREAESLAQRSVMDLDSARSQIFTLEKQVEVLANDRKILESRVNELKDQAASSIELQEMTKSLGDTLSAKDQEIEGLMQALDEEESQMEELGNRNIQLENILQENNLKLESLEASRSKAVSKLSTTMSKFDELHNLSESFLAEIENLQSQLQGRDSEISFLRQEVTRCTNDILTSQETTNKHSSDIHELLKWMEMMISRCGSPRTHHSDQGGSQIREYTEILEKKIVSIMTELDDLRIKVESNEALLQIERGRVEELSCKTEVLESSLREKETQIELFEGRTDSSQRASINSPGASEIEQVVQRNQVTLGPIKTHVRGSRKVNNDYIAIAVDPEKGSNVLEDEDDDKAHGFKSLTMSRIVPRASRPISDRIDGIWVSGDRLLMRQPTLRLGLMIYWIALHILLASAI